MQTLIDQAKEEIHLQVYIFDPDTTGNKILDALLRATSRGVHIYLVIDDFGSIRFRGQYQEKIKNTGIKIRYFSPGMFGLHFGKRLHHKVVVIDRYQALIGGINIADRYSGYDGREAWLDYAVYLKGSIGINIEKICRKIFDKKPFLLRPKFAQRSFLRRRALKKQSSPVTISENDWYRGKYEITHSHRQVLREANESIFFIASYFLPGYRLKRLIKRAAKRNVKICFLLPGKSDVLFFIRATHYLYRWMLRNHIEIYTWQRSVLHAKAAIVDDNWATIGSYNLISLSDYGSIEMNVEIRDKKFIQHFKEELQHIIKTECIRVDESYLKKQNLFSKFFDWMAFQFIRVSMAVYLFLSAKKE